MAFCQSLCPISMGSARLPDLRERLGGQLNSQPFCHIYAGDSVRHWHQEASTWLCLIPSSPDWIGPNNAATYVMQARSRLPHPPLRHSSLHAASKSDNGIYTFPAQDERHAASDAQWCGTVCSQESLGPALQLYQQLFWMHAQTMADVANAIGHTLFWLAPGDL